MTDPRIDAWARTLVTYSTGVQPGDVVSIEGEVSARPLLGAIYRETLRAGGLPVMIPRFGELTALVKQAEVDVQDGELNLSFTASEGEPIVAAIEVLQPAP